MIVVVDYGRGNLYSVGNALRHLGASYRITSDPEDIVTAGRILLPGVGAFGDAMQGLRQRGLVEPLRTAAGERHTPLLGICLGMHLLATEGTEFGRHEGLNLISGTVRHLPTGGGHERDPIPNVGWRKLNTAPDDPSSDLGSDSMVYFSHSYGFFPDDLSSIVATISVNGSTPAAIVRTQNVLGFQFHPEKSGPVGLKLIESFLLGTA